MRQSNGNFSEEEMAGLSAVLGMGTQVNAHAQSAALRTHMSIYGGGVTAQETRSAPGLFRHMQEHGGAPANAGEEALYSIKKLFKLTGEKEAKKALAVESFGEFFDFMRRAKVLTRNAHEKDPEAFWQMLWHYQSVTHIMVEWGWPTAKAYNAKVMQCWKDGDLHLPSQVDTEQFRSGNIGGSLHMLFYNEAMNEVRPTKVKKASAGGGTNAKAKIYCSFCNLWQGHDVKNCQKKNTAEKAARLKAGKP